MSNSIRAREKKEQNKAINVKYVLMHRYLYLQSNY